MRITTIFTRHLKHPLRLVPLLCLLLIVGGCRTKAPVADGVSPAVEPGVSPGGKGVDNTTNMEPSIAVPDAKLPPSTAGEAPAATIPVTPAHTSDEIVIAGQFIHTGTRVVLWTDTNGYNAYRLERHFTPNNSTTTQDTENPDAGRQLRKRYDQRDGELTNEELKRVRANGWDLPTLQRCIDQFVIHYDVAGTSRQCFYILHDRRFLSVHFMLDLDGTIYQTLDAQERARHASGANDRSVGIEIANIGAYPTNDTSTLDRWYERDTNGQVRVTLPERFGDGGLLTTNFIARPARMDAITNTIHGRTLVQYDFTPEQYAALAHLTAALCRALPQIKCDAPRDTVGKVLAEKVPDEELEKYRGLVGHYHLTTNKIDPGPAFDWEKLLGEARRLINESAANITAQPSHEEDELAGYRPVPIPENISVKLRTLVQKYYPKVSFPNYAFAEYDVTTFEFPYNGPRNVKHETTTKRGPKSGGILCNVYAAKGRYQGQLALSERDNGQFAPFEIDRGFYKDLLMAPYSSKRDVHLWVALSYPPDTNEEFLKEFRAIITAFEEDAD